MMVLIRKTIAKKPSGVDTRHYLCPTQDESQKVYRYKIASVIGSPELT